MSSFDGESNFRDVVNGLDSENREDYKRLNVILQRNEPVMDNTSRMDELTQLIDLNPQMIQECEETTYALLIASFACKVAALRTAVTDRPDSDMIDTSPFMVTTCSIDLGLSQT